jgi:hypothetical protein
MLPLLTIGDDVAVHIARKTRDPVGDTDLVKIAVDGGAVTRPLVTDVHAAADLADGRLSRCVINRSMALAGTAAPPITASGNS